MPRWPFVVTAFGLALVIVGAALRPLVDLLPPELWRTERPQAAAPEPVRATVGGVALTIPRDLVRSEAQRRNAEYARLELALPWPPHEGDASRAPRPSLSNTVFVTLAPSDEAIDATQRLAAVYARFLENEIRAEPQGLASRRFRIGSGYDGEDLVYDPARPGAYFVRCAPAAGDAPPACLRETRYGHRLDVVYRFPRHMLEDWRRLDMAIGALLAAIGVPGA